MSFLRFLISKTFLKHLLLAIILGCGFVFGTLLFLHLYTRHGKSLAVPDFEGYTIDEVRDITRLKRLRYEVTDSVYLQNKPKGTVVDQNPKPGFRVKKNRCIHLVMNAVAPEEIKMIKVTGISLRAAKAELEMVGLRLGKISYKPYRYPDNVFQQKYKGEYIEPGDPVFKGAKIDLTVGSGGQDQLTKAPDVTGLSLYRAEGAISDALMNHGEYSYDETVESWQDTLKAFVYKQDPEPGRRVLKGTGMDFYLTIDENKMPGTDTTNVD